MSPWRRGMRLVFRRRVSPGVPGLMMTSGGAPSLPAKRPQAGLPERSNQRLISVSVVVWYSRMMPLPPRHWPGPEEPGRPSTLTWLHTVCLSYLPNGDLMVVVGFFGGADHRPAWCQNLRAIPEVIVRDRERIFLATTETLADDEWGVLWEARIATAPRYARY